jgi:signal transduction histidine kinase/ActR/RegA family two-component response regulator
MSNSLPNEQPRLRGLARRIASAQAMLGVPLIAILFVLHLGLSQTAERLIQTQFELYQSNSVLQKSALAMVQARRAVDLAAQQRDSSLMYHAADTLQSAIALLREGMWGVPGTPAHLPLRVEEQLQDIDRLTEHVEEAAQSLAAGQRIPGMRKVSDRLDVLYIAFRELQAVHEVEVHALYTRLAVQQQRYQWAVRGTLLLLLLMNMSLIWMFVTQRQTLRKLRRASEQAERATRAKSDFLTVMSHEIRTPLNGIIGVADLLDRSTLDAGQRDLVGVVRDSGAHLLRLIDDILDFSRIEAGDTPLVEEPFDLAAVVRQVVANQRHARPDDKVSIECDIGGNVPPVILGDATRYAQIVANLVGNALKFTPEGEISVDVDVIGTHTRRELVIRVRDTGIGIDPRYREAMYQPFAQADSSIVRTYGGTGLGLAITRRLVEAMDGDISARSVPGQGTEFLIHLPLRVPPETDTPASDNAQVAMPAAAEMPARTLRVLVVDDNPVNQMVTRRMLETLRHQVDIAADGREGIDRALAEDYDLVLMDLQMPEVSGLEATRAIRERKPGCRIVALSANAMPEHRQAAAEAGMDGFLAKPVRLGDLEGLLATHFGLLPRNAENGTGAAAGSGDDQTK